MERILGIGTYIIEELSQISGINPKKEKAKRDIKHWLEKQGYKIAQDRRHIIEILDIPKPNLDLYLKQKFGINSYEFKCYLYMICNDKKFCAMPNKARAKVLKEKFGVEVSEQTISGSWNKKLYKTELAIKDQSNKKKWYSCSIDGERYQEEVANNDKEWFSYWKDFYVWMKEDATTARDKLTAKYGGCYFSCKEIALCAWGFQNEFINILNKEMEA